jgi:hypothetical protein
LARRYSYSSEIPGLLESFSEGAIITRPPSSKSRAFSIFDTNL